MVESRSIDILLVEDNPGDVRLIKEAFKESKILRELYVVEDGVEAMDFLCKTGKYADANPVQLIILDLNLPKKDGREVLKEIKSNENLKRIPVVILTSSESPNDILNTYNNYANCYITKPADFIQFIKTVLSIENFWLSLARLPA